MKTLIASLLVLFTLAMPSYAQVSEEQWNQLDEVSRLEIQKQITEKALAQAKQAEEAITTVDKVIESVSEVDVEIGTVNKWTIIAEAAADAIIAFSTKLGVAAGEFLTSPSGIFFSIIALFWFAGESIISFFVGLALMTIIPKYIYTTMVKIFGVDDKVPTEVTIDDKGREVIQYKIVRRLKTEVHDPFSAIFTLVLIAVSIVAGIKFIF